MEITVVVVYSPSRNNLLSVVFRGHFQINDIPYEDARATITQFTVPEGTKRVELGINYFQVNDVPLPVVIRVNDKEYLQVNEDMKLTEDIIDGKDTKTEISLPYCGIIRLEGIKEVRMYTVHSITG